MKRKTKKDQAWKPQEVSKNKVRMKEKNKGQRLLCQNQIELNIPHQEKN